MKLRLKKKKKQRKPGSGNHLSYHTVQSMFEMYCAGKKAPAIAAAHDITEATVYTYIREGYPERNVEAFKARKARILKNALSIEDGLIADKLARHMKFGAAGFGVTSGRLLARYQAASRLSEVDVSEEERQRLLPVAKEPDVEDMMAFHRVVRDTMNIALAAEKINRDIGDGAPVNVNVQQNSLATSVNDSRHSEEADKVFSFIGGLSTLSSKDQGKLSKIVLRMDDKDPKEE